MIHHVVLFQLTPDATPERIAGLRDVILAMQGRIPEIRGIAFGPNLAPSAAEWPWCLLVLVDDMAAVQRYTEHPVHVEMVERHLAPIRAARLAVDFAVA